ncbi:MAG: PD40 domain-containing protein, partial [Actinobacteria bacterium]|nr:PD40 domain-containing protein [Actinomycetota bacterium]
MKAVAMLATLGAISLAASAPGAPPNPGPGFSSVSNLGPAWSPDGKRIAFTTYAYGRAQIAAIDVSGRRVVRLTNDAFSDFQPRFRRDGTLVFSGQDAGVDFVATLDRSGRTVKLPLPGSGADLSPDGKRIVYQVRDEQIPQYQLWVAKADGGNARMLVTNANQDDPHPRWSPDGERIAYVAGANTEFRTIHVIGADDGNDRALTSGGHEWQPAWSPDGRRIAYAEGPFTVPNYS